MRKLIGRISFIVLTGLCLSDHAYSIPTQVDTCELISTGPSVDLTKTEVSLQRLLEGFIQDLEPKNISGIHRHFDPKDNLDESFGDKLHSILRNRYHGKVSYSIYRVWRISNPSKQKPILDSCPRSDGMKIVTKYYEEKQYAVWIQIHSDTELGRLYLEIAPRKGIPHIVGFRVQQWTQLGKDWEAWTQEGQKFAKEGNKIQAYLAFDIAQKLSICEDLVLCPWRADLLNLREAVLTQAEFVNQLNSTIGSKSIVYATSMIDVNRNGIFLRVAVKPDALADESGRLCYKIGNDLMKAGITNPSQTVRCNFVPIGSDGKQDSVLGSRSFSSSELKEPFR